MHSRDLILMFRLKRHCNSEVAVSLTAAIVANLPEGTMNNKDEKEIFGDLSQHERADDALLRICAGIMRDFPREREYERFYLMAAIRRTLSLGLAFRQAIESNNGQMAMILVRLNLDTLARIYALYWAEQTEGMTAESFSRDIANGKKIGDMKLKGAKTKATDKWLIEQIESLGVWISEAYQRTSGAVHFSDFHIHQLLQQARPLEDLPDGALLSEMIVGPCELNADPELYRELKQAFLHISLMLLEVVRQRTSSGRG
ncbi:hypothetical protein FJU08_06820 [Martelella alba]|uniref:Uncharacterized protein n=1 Tax=Martelella alba TaxID=2590451 RepID=A0A506UEY3_9HYPH|nr:hypothetical protein [Martelella alba]TPW31465.1 hypothetical protein FJU08_06820 [Martelella alba]